MICRVSVDFCQADLKILLHCSYRLCLFCRRRRIGVDRVLVRLRHFAQASQADRPLLTASSFLPLGALHKQILRSRGLKGRGFTSVCLPYVVGPRIHASKLIVIHGESVGRHRSFLLAFLATAALYDWWVDTVLQNTAKLTRSTECGLVAQQEKVKPSFLAGQ